MPMSDFERDVIDRLGRIETMLDADYRALHGNGKPGLVEKHAELEDRVLRLEEAASAAEKSKRSLWELVGLLATAAGTIYAIFFKH